MAFQNPIQTGQMPDFYESSVQRTRTGRDSESVGKAWQKSRVQGQQILQVRKAVEQTQRQLNRLRRHGGGSGLASENWFPFKIYKSPTNPAWGQVEKDAKAWRTFRVRNGFYGLQEAAHSDRVEDPYGDEVPPFLGVAGNPGDVASCDFVVDSNLPYAFVWLDIVSFGEPAVFIDQTPPVAGWTSTGGWNDGSHILIGWIDTGTDATTKTAHVRQIVADDIPIPVAKASMYRLKGIGNDVVVARPWNGVAESGVNTTIAKVHKLRNSITSEVLEGTTYYYDYRAGPDSLNNYRDARTGSHSGLLVETCVVTPEWIANDLIYAVPCVTGVTGANYIMLGDGRAWAAH